jgi:uncharacterized protein (DUF305 family)
MSVSENVNPSLTPVNSASRPPNNRLLMLLAVLIWMLAAGVIGFLLGSNRVSLPSTDSADAGFARDMSFHHANAVELALIAYDQTEDQEIRFFAQDIALTQQAQIGQMQGWLNIWGLPLTSIAPAMTWMGTPVAEGTLMPGIATEDELAELSTLQGIEADIAFLNLMILHHQSGVHMAEAILEKTDRPEVRRLAQAMVTAQAGEIDYMRTLIERKGGVITPEAATDMADMDHD